MREIKFRVYDKDLKRMRYLQDQHDFIEFGEDGNAVYHNMQTGYGEWFSDLMQYTGLKDKKGVEIYEGDIIRFKGNYQDKQNYVVFYDNMKAGFFIVSTHCYDWRLEHQYYIRANFINAKNKEVIGNIYDNPELLEGDK